VESRGGRFEACEKGYDLKLVVSQVRGIWERARSEADSPTYVGDVQLEFLREAKYSLKHRRRIFVPSRGIEYQNDFF
jgi:hypothetical protein